MLHLSKILHVLALGLWFGTVIFFSFVVGLNLFGTFEKVAEKEPEEREVWFPMWNAYDGPSLDPALPEPLRKEQGTRAAGVALGPLFRWYFGIQTVCAVLATATVLSWRQMGIGRVHTARAGVLLAALVTVALGWWLLHVVENLREPRNSTFDEMVRHSPPRAEDVRAAIDARQAFMRWHLVSLGVNMVTVLLVTIAMAQAAYLPAMLPTKQGERGV